MPLQFEGCGKFVDAFVQQLHHIIVTAIQYDLADPDRAAGFNVHDGAGGDDLASGHPSETFPHAFEDARPIVAPLILIIVANKIGHSFPVSVFDRMKEVLCMQPDLMLRSPKPDEVQPSTSSHGQPDDEPSTK